MKQIIAICAVALSLNTYSNCADDFNRGVTQYEFAMDYFNSGSLNYQAAVDESRGQGRRSVVCNALVKSNTGFNVATTSFNHCIDSFTQAISSCSGQSRNIATENRDVCFANHDIAKGNYEQILATLKATCFKSNQSTLSLELPEIQTEI